MKNLLSLSNHWSKSKEEVVPVRPLDNYMLEIEFQDGLRKVIDIHPFIGRGVSALRSTRPPMSSFNQFETLVDNEDSIRFYFLGAEDVKRIIRLGDPRTVEERIFIMH